jgi:hypothetical protein
MSKYVLTENDQINIEEVAYRALAVVGQHTKTTGMPLLAAQVLVGSFAWDTSPEGHKYWAGVYDKLLVRAGLPPVFASGDPEDAEEESEDGEEERSPDTDRVIRAA